MGLLSSIGRSERFRGLLGWTIAKHIRFVHHTTRFTFEPPDYLELLARERPCIVAMWHSQVFNAYLTQFGPGRNASLTSKSRDGEIPARTGEHLGIRVIRGSGARGRDQRQKGGSSALRAMLRALRDGENMYLTADVPKIARRVGLGIVTLARMSGRPIVPIAVATRNRFVLDSWDRTNFSLPFGRGAIVAGRPISVAPDADAEALEEARLAVERELDRIHERAFALTGRDDPGAAMRSEAAG